RAHDGRPWRACGRQGRSERRGPGHNGKGRPAPRPERHRRGAPLPLVRVAAHRHPGAGEAMTDVSEVYEIGLVSSGKLKIRATARLAEGTPDAVFDACVLLHEAARIERRLAGVLPTCSAATRLAASVEECFCLLEGRDPPGAARVWGRILREREDVEE